MGARSLSAISAPHDVVYSCRPFDELPEILAIAQRIGAKAIWNEKGPDAPGAERARQTVESAGLVCIDAPRITDAARGRGRERSIRATS